MEENTLYYKEIIPLDQLYDKVMDKFKNIPTDCFEFYVLSYKGNNVKELINNNHPSVWNFFNSSCNKVISSKFLEQVKKIENRRYKVNIFALHDSQDMMKIVIRCYKK